MTLRANALNSAKSLSIKATLDNAFVLPVLSSFFCYSAGGVSSRDLHHDYANGQATQQLKRTIFFITDIPVELYHWRTLSVDYFYRASA